jgi:hypothetical protein
MALNKLLAGAAVALSATFVAQVGLKYADRPDRKGLAVWAAFPRSLADASKLADRVVLGEVVNVARAEDLVFESGGEKEDAGRLRIAVEAVEVRVLKNYKGKADHETLTVFHTGLSQAESPAEKAPPPGPPPPRPPDGIDQPAAPQPSRKGVTTISVLDGDPSYKVGERYLLFLQEGPTLKVRGQEVRSNAIANPSMRFRVGADSSLDPIAKHGFAKDLQGKPLAHLERQILSGQIEPRLPDLERPKIEVPAGKDKPDDH